MLFNSYVFVFAFLPVVLLGWWSIRGQKQRLLFLTLASYLFYAWWDPRFLPLMLATTGADYYAGKRISMAQNEHARKAWLVAVLCFNLGLLGVFKYLAFAVNAVNHAAAWMNMGPVGIMPPIILPIGISFYTFNSISYTIDVYRRRTPRAGSLLEFATFVAMFPHLVAGPIIRYAEMRRQLVSIPESPPAGFSTFGIWLFVAGMVKKVIIADTIARRLVDPLFANPGDLHIVTSWLAAVSYAVQIYFDFSGYSDMAVGLALMLGLRFPQNFDSPYKAISIADFWRRWHMSLSMFLRDYLYMPLGGSDGGHWKTVQNLALTMAIGGLWHGAAWTFIVWGLYHGVLLAAHALLRANGWTPRSRPLNTLLTFAAVVIGWVIFRSASLGGAAIVVNAMLGGAGIESLSELRNVVGSRSLALLTTALVLIFAFPNTWEVRFPRGRLAAVFAAGALIACAMSFAHASPFLYFQF